MIDLTREMREQGDVAVGAGAADDSGGVPAATARIGSRPPDQPVARLDRVECPQVEAVVVEPIEPAVLAGLFDRIDQLGAVAEPVDDRASAEVRQCTDLARTSYRRVADDVVELASDLRVLPGQCPVAVDRHLAKHKNKAAFIFVPESETEAPYTLTYQELHTRVNETAAVLRDFCGLKAGDRVTIHMPMILELPIAMLACARIGADRGRAAQRWQEHRQRARPQHGQRPQELQPAQAGQQAEHQAPGTDLELQPDE